MKRFSSQHESDEPAAQINISPLVDMVFLLLIFFMVTSVFVSETGITVSRPKAQTAVQQPRTSLTIALSRDNRIFFGGAEIPLPKVKALLQREMGAQPLPVIILADKASATGPLVALIDQCRLSGAPQVNVAAEAQ